MKVKRVLPVQPFAATQQYDWRQATPRKPDDLLVGKTIFYLRPMPSVSFDPEAQMIAVEPEGRVENTAIFPGHMQKCLLQPGMDAKRAVFLG